MKLETDIGMKLAALDERQQKIESAIEALHRDTALLAESQGEILARLDTLFSLVESIIAEETESENEIVAADMAAWHAKTGARLPRQRRRV